MGGRAGGGAWDSATTFVPNGVPTDPTSIGLAGGTEEDQPYNSVWWTFTPPVDGRLTFDTYASTYDPAQTSAPDTYIVLYRGADEATKVQVARNDDTRESVSSEQDLLSKLPLTPVEAGITYHLRVGTYDETDDLPTAYVVTGTFSVDTYSDWIQADDITALSYPLGGDGTLHHWIMNASLTYAPGYPPGAPTPTQDDYDTISDALQARTGDYVGQYLSPGGFGPVYVTHQFHDSHDPFFFGPPFGASQFDGSKSWSVYAWTCWGLGNYHPLGSGPTGAAGYQWEDDLGVGGNRQSVAVSAVLTSADPSQEVGWLQYNYEYGRGGPTVGGSWQDEIFANTDPSHFTYSVSGSTRYYYIQGGIEELEADSTRDVILTQDPVVPDSVEGPEFPGFIPLGDIDLTDYLHGTPEEGFVLLQGDTNVSSWVTMLHPEAWYGANITNDAQVGGFLAAGTSGTSATGSMALRYTLRPIRYRWIIPIAYDLPDLPDEVILGQIDNTRVRPYRRLKA